MLSYEQQEEFYNNLIEESQVFSETIIMEMLRLLGNPQHRIKVIHIENVYKNKFTVNYLQEIFKLSGKKVGILNIFESQTFEDKIQINGEKINKEDFLKHTDIVRKLVLTSGKLNIGLFPVFIMLAANYFIEKQVDLAVIILPKGAIFDLLTSSISKSDSQSYAWFAQGTNVFPINYDNKKIQILSRNLENIEFIYDDMNYTTSLISDYNVHSAILALEILRFLNFKIGLSISDESIKCGIKNAKKEGSLEKISDSPFILVDAASKLEEINDLYEYLFKVLNKKIIGIYSTESDFLVGAGIQDALSKFDKLILFQPKNGGLQNDGFVSLDRLENLIIKGGRIVPMFSTDDIEELYNFISVKFKNKNYFGEKNDVEDYIFIVFGSLKTSLLLKSYLFNRFNK